MKHDQDVIPSIAEKKAALCLQLLVACRKPPNSVNGGGVIQPRKWVSSRKTAKRALGSPRSSVRVLEKALGLMREYESGSPGEHGRAA